MASSSRSTTGKPDFPLVCERVLHRHSTIPLTYLAFDPDLLAL
jgi:hypothetical protein